MNVCLTLTIQEKTQKIYNRRKKKYKFVIQLNVMLIYGFILFHIFGYCKFWHRN